MNVVGLSPNRRAGQILILGFYLDNFRDKNRRKIGKTGARNEKTAQKSKSKSRAGFILLLGSKWRRFVGAAGQFFTTKLNPQVYYYTTNIENGID